MIPLLQRERAAPPAAAVAPPRRDAALRLSWRLVRRTTAVMWLTVAAYMTVEVLSFRNAYPDAASRARLLELSRSTAVRMLQGRPGAIDTAGGFAIWDGGWMLSLIVACWAVLTITRLTRGDEDSGRIELVLSRPVDPRRALAAALGAVGIGLAGMALAATVTFLALGEPVAGAVLWGAGVAAFGAVPTALGALSAQLVAPRRRSVSLALGLVALAFLVRVTANSADGRSWLLTTTPFGWLDELSAFTRDRWLWLLAPVAAVVVLTVVALALAGRRDVGAAVRASRTVRRSRLRMLGGAGAFGWRLTSGALAAWAVGLAVSALVFGMMIGAIVDFIAKDATYRRLLASMGMDTAAPVTGFVSYLVAFLALPFALYVAWRIGALRQEEADGRLDNILVRGVPRRRLLAVAAGQALLAACLLCVVSGAALWAGAHAANVAVPVRDVAEPLAGTLPLVVLFVGVSVLTFGFAPRLTVAVPVTLAVVGYLLDTFGAMLHWPAWVIGTSPFHHLARLPNAPMTAASGSVLLGLGLLAAIVGIVGFSRRDLTGA